MLHHIALVAALWPSACSDHHRCNHTLQVLNLEGVIAALKDPSKVSGSRANAINDSEVDYDTLEDITMLRDRVAARDAEIASLRAELAEATAAARHAQAHARAAKSDAVKTIQEHVHALREAKAECVRLTIEVERLTNRLYGGQSDGHGSLRDEIAAQVSVFESLEAILFCCICTCT